jgi:hypothetical protein
LSPEPDKGRRARPSIFPHQFAPDKIGALSSFFCDAVSLILPLPVVDSTVQQERGRQTMANETPPEQIESALCA